MSSRFPRRLAVSLLLVATTVRVAYSQNPTLDKIKQQINRTLHKPATPAPPPPAPAQGAAVTQQGAAIPALNAKADEALMGPRSQRIVLSEDGEHIGIATAKGSREIVLLDGVEGPVFDEIPRGILGGQSEITWSPTGGHSAYVARRGGDFIAVVDGKEASIIYNTTDQSGIGGTDTRGWKFWFSADGSRLAFATVSKAGWTMTVDGVKGPAYKALDFNQTVINGKHVIYLAQTPDNKWHPVVDGKVGPAYDEIKNLLVTPDGAHYAFLANRFTQPAPNTVPKNALVVIDGAESAPEALIQDLEQAPDGRTAYVVYKNQPGQRENPGHLMVGGLDVPNTQMFSNPVPNGNSPQRHVAWNPDGKRFAYIQSNSPNPGVTVMVNGKPMGQSYTSDANLSWSPSGAHLMYVGASNTGQFPVIDGQELDGYNWVRDFQWSPDGTRYGFFGMATNAIWMIIDGKPQPKTINFQAGSLRFSPDSKHVAYGAQTTVTNYQPVVDGVLKPHNLQYWVNRNNPPLQFPVFSWSPDGNHLAYVGFTLESMPKGGVIVDGTLYQGPTASFSHPSWSPDSKHFAAMVTTGHGWGALVDGKLSPLYEDILSLNLAAVRFSDPHTLRFYAVKAGQVFRERLTIQ